MPYRIGIDTGGTFTDTVIIDEKGGVTISKAPSTPKDFSLGLMDSLGEAGKPLHLSRETLLANTDIFALGTTVVVNALLTRTGAKVGLITTKGVEDTILIGRVHQKVAGLSEREITDLVRLDKPEPIIPRPFIIGVSERMDYRGEVLIPLNAEEVKEAAARLVAKGVDSIAVCFLWSFLNSQHEQETKRIIRQLYPDLPVTVSTEVAPLMGEYERTATVALSSFVAPTASDYIQRIEGGLKSQQLQTPLLLMQSVGGVATAKEIINKPLNLVQSGPVGGVMACKYWGEMLGHKNIICTDVGGTSFDVGLIVNDEALFVEGSIVEKYHTFIPTVDISSIGTGGGSTAWVEPGTKILRVGPQSAGAEPGPVCYDMGGKEPTLTDAAVVLGYINPDYFLGGRAKLNKEKAASAIKEKVAAPLGMSVVEAASGILDISNSQMADLIRKVIISKGQDPEHFILYVYGAAGPQYASVYAREVGCKTIVIPPAASVFSAFGIASSDITTLRSSSFPMIMPIDVERLNKIYGDLEKQATDDLHAAGFREQDIVLSRFAYMRFRRQVHEVRVPVRGGKLIMEEVKNLISTFEEIYESLYGKESAYKEAGIEMVTYLVMGVGKTQKPTIKRLPLGGVSPEAALKGKRNVYFRENGCFIPVNIYNSESLQPGNVIEGPAIIEAPTTTIAIQPGQMARIDEYLNTIVELKSIRTPLVASRTSREGIDPVTFEILRHRLWAINDEAAATIKLVSGSSIATECGDFNTGLLDAEGNQLIVGIYVTAHAAALDLVAKYILSEYQDNPGIDEDDMFLCGDPYIGTLHQMDIACLAPIHWKGELIAWSGCTIHQLDVGGPVPGGFAVGAHSIYEEPLPLSPLKIVEKGRVRKDIERDYLIRSRVPALVALDLRAQISANNVVKHRIHQLIEAYGVETVKAVMKEMIDYAENRLRARLRELPDGTWRHTLFIEHDSTKDKVYAGRLTMIKVNDTLTFDLTESSEQAPAVINASKGVISAVALLAVLPLLAYDMPWTTAGILRAIKIITKPGTLMHPIWPAGVCGAPISSMRVGAILVNVCIGKMFSACEKYRDRAAAGWMGSICTPNIYGVNQRGENFGNFLLDGVAGGGASRSYKDGVDSGASITSMATAIANVETNEYIYPLLYLYRRQAKDSGGPGKFRGGVGTEEAFTMYGTREPFTFVHFSYGTEQPCSSGICGGYPGSTAAYLVIRKSNFWDLLRENKMAQGVKELTGNFEVSPPMCIMRIDHDDVIVHHHPGGGGYGDPFDRDPHLVLKDVVNGLVSLECAKDIYGVVIGRDFQLDPVGTEKQRQVQRAKRGAGVPRATPLVSSSEKEAKPISEYLEIVASNEGQYIRCRKCRTLICRKRENYKEHSIMREYPITQAGPGITPYKKTERFILREFYCPGCFTLLETEVNLKDAPLIWDIQMEDPL